MVVLSAADAARAITAAVSRQPTLRMPLLSARGHILADDCIAPIDLPPWTNASMDGYAARASDLRGASAANPVRLQVVSSVAAGSDPGRMLEAGEVARIFTGAPLPAGTDSVVRQEDVNRDGDWITLSTGRDAGRNVRQAGGDVTCGELVLRAGTILGPHQLALLAALAVANPMVHRQPRIGIVASGDELVSLDHPEEILSGRRLADVNTTALAALVGETGGIPVPLGIARDDPHALEQLVSSVGDIDLLISAGGVGVGDHDHVRTVMTVLGATMTFDRVRMRPGGPTAFGVLPGGRPWLALPGNPVSAMVTFELFGRVAIRTMAGDRDPFRPVFRTLLSDSVPRDATLDQYLRVTFSQPDGAGAPLATLTGPQGSGMLMSVARAEGLVIVPAGSGSLAAGSPVSALRFG
jgi:molybdopterin molybdotransferase